MLINVIGYLIKQSKNNPEKIAIIEKDNQITYKDLYEHVVAVSSCLQPLTSPKEVVGVYMEKGIAAVTSFLALARLNNCYTLLNPALPSTRLKKMSEVVELKHIVTTKDLYAECCEIFSTCHILVIDDLLVSPFKDEMTRISIDTNPLYINFTSGSTGTPKAIAVSQRSVIDFIYHFTTTFAISQEDVIANQAPFDFDVSVKDIYSALAVGATLLIVPKEYFSQPVALVDYLCEYRATTMIWAVSAIALLSAFHALDYRTPETINKVLFSGEVMPLKHLKNFQKHLPQATFVNLYGPTEITCNCTYHVIDSNRDYSQTGIPIGKAFVNEEVFLLDENNQLIEDESVVGELCVRGSALALGYYANPTQTSKAFVQNPLNPYYPELIYRTGDLAFYDDNHELVFAGRRDFQIKYKGHRIELEEIEQAILGIDGVEQCIGIFDEKKSRLKVAFSGSVEDDVLLSEMKIKLPEYMLPSRLVKLPLLPLNKNGKIDRHAVKEMV